jgi:hypothetical protein
MAHHLNEKKDVKDVFFSGNSRVSAQLVSAKEY